MIDPAAVPSRGTFARRAARWFGALALVALGATAGFARPAGADESGWAQLDIPDHVTAGQTITLELARAPGDVEEMEILLSLDDGRTFPVRVTREIEAGEREVRWKVPALATASARLRIRFGEEGRETWGPISESFTIVTDGSRAELHLFHENGWWEGLDSAPAGGAAGDLATGAPTLVAGRAFEPLALPSTPPAVSGRAPARPLWSLASAAPEAPSSLDRSTLRERSFPLRN